jgi:hypothetical protein
MGFIAKNDSPVWNDGSHKGDGPGRNGPFLLANLLKCAVFWRHMQAELCRAQLVRCGRVGKQRALPTVFMRYLVSCLSSLWPDLAGE